MKREKVILLAAAVVMVGLGLVLLNLGMSHAQKETSVENLEPGTAVSQERSIMQQPFQVLISGMDTYGKLKKKGRSDVNLLLTVNPATKEILVTATPRDAYVACSKKDKEKKDKLCHLSCYGIKRLVQGMEMLYDTEIDYYVQLNFSGFMKLVDAIGGVTVECEKAFKSDWGTSYVKGKNELDGKDALAFVRERHHFTEGDQERVKNHMVMSETVFQQVMTKSLFEMDINSLYQLWKENVRTNFKMGEIMSLMKHQLENKDEWKLNLSTLEGEGAMAMTASYEEHKLYVLKLKKASVEKAREKIREAMKESTEE